MDRRIPIIVFVTLLHAQAIRAQGVEVLHFEHVSDLRARDDADTNADLRAATPVRETTSGGAITLDFIAFGERFELALEPNARVNAAVRRASSRATAYKGQLRDHPESWARVVLSDTGPSGLIWDGTTLYGIESPSDSLVGADTPTIFRLDDVYVPPGTLACGLEQAPMSGMEMFASVATELAPMAATGATLNLDIGAVADFEFSQAQADPSAAILTRLNMVDGIFSQQLGIQITVQQIDVFTDADDPFTASDASGLLDELATYRGTEPGQDELGLTHLFTGRNLDGNTVGIAYFGALCSQNYSAGLTQSTLGAALESLIAAHEIGHNFGAPHDGDDECPETPQAGAEYLMSSSLNPLSLNRDRFSVCSIEQMQIEIDGASCLTTIDYVDVALSAIPLAMDPLTEREFTYTVMATNLGGADAAAVAVELALDPDLEIVSVTPAAGSCGPAQSDITCDLGALPGSTSRNITLRLRADNAGPHSVTAALTAADDIDGSNNALNDTLDVIAAADLSMSAGALSLERGQSGNLNVTLRNLSGIRARSVELTASLSPGLGIDSATLSGQACVVDTDTASCSIASLDGLTSTTLVLGLSGLTSGTQNIDLAAIAVEVDPNPGDNALPVSVEVTEPPRAERDGGGGSTGPVGVVALLVVVAWLRRARDAKRPQLV